MSLQDGEPFRLLSALESIALRSTVQGSAASTRGLAPCGLCHPAWPSYAVKVLQLNETAVSIGLRLASLHGISLGQL